MGTQQFNLVKEICIEYNTEIITLLKEKGFKYRIWEMKDFTPYQTEEELQEKKYFFSFDTELINKYSKIANFLRWSLNELLEDILKSELRDYIDEPKRIIDVFLNNKDLLELILSPEK